MAANNTAQLSYLKKTLKRVSSVRKLSSRRSVDVEVLMVTLKKLQSECLFSDNLWCQDFECTLYPLTCRTSKICSVSYLVNEEATVPCLLFCHENHALNYAHNYFPCKTICCLAERGICSVEIEEVFKNCVNLCNISVLIYDLRKRAQSNLTLCKVTSWMNMIYYTDQ